MCEQLHHKGCNVKKLSADRYDQLRTRWDLVRLQVDSRIQELSKLLLEGTPARLREAIEYSLFAPGKRLRPLLVVLSSQACSGDSKLAYTLGAAVEMVHCYSLIHDDLPAMDDDDLRRGQPTCHRKFDEATAILAGDALQAMAFRVIGAEWDEPAQAVEATMCLAQASGPAGMVGGQMDDLLAETQGGDAKFLQSIHRRKTGAMITLSVDLGAMAGGASSLQRTALRRYGDRIGLAFQIVDDILDEESTTGQLGKTSGKDRASGKLTYPKVFGLEESRELAAKLIEDSTKELKVFGERAQPLVDLAHFVIDRSH